MAGGSAKETSGGKRWDGQYDPFQSFRFKVRFGGLGYMDGGAVTAASFQQCSGVKASTQLLRVRTGADIRGVQGIVPTTTEYGNITLSRGVITSNAFLDWVFSAFPGYATGPMTPPLVNRKTIDIVVLDEHGKERVTWTLYGAYPASYELASLDASQDGVLTESLEFAYVGLKRAGS